VKKIDVINPTNIKVVSELGSIEKAWFAPSNTNRIASISTNGKFHIWDINKSTQPIELPKGEGKVLELRFDPINDDRILRINDNNTVTVLQIKNKKILKELPSISLIGEAEFNPTDHNQVVTGSKDGTIQIWNLEDSTNKSILKFSANRQPIWHIAFDKNNPNYILTTGNDNVARIWDISNLSIKAELSGHKKIVVDGSFDSNNSNRVITTSQDGSIRIWDLNKSGIPLVIRGKVGMVSGSFIPHNSNKITALDSDGRLLFYTIGNKELMVLSQASISRCLTKSELSNYELKWLPSEIKHLTNKPYCNEKIFVQNKKESNSFDSAILPTWYSSKLY
jgi:WD40 repeat protein